MSTKKDKNSNSSIYVIVSFIVIGLGLLIGLIFIILLYSKGYRVTGELSNATNVFGTYLGGVIAPLFSLAGVLLFYNALKIQSAELKVSQNILVAQKQELSDTRKVLVDQQYSLERQANILDKQSFETTFFNLLNNLTNIKKEILSDPNKSKFGSSLDNFFRHEIDDIDSQELKKKFSSYYKYWKIYFDNIYLVILFIDKESTNKEFYFSLLYSQLESLEKEGILYYGVIEPKLLEILRIMPSELLKLNDVPISKKLIDYLNRFNIKIT